MEAKDFPFPLDTDIIEQVPVRKMAVDSVDDKTGAAKYSMRTVLENQTVRYINAPKEKHKCKDGQHFFRVLNKRRYLFSCDKCQYVRKVYPSTYRFIEATGALVHRQTGQTV